MKSSRKLFLLGQLTLMSAFVYAGPAAADDPMICAVTKAIACQKHGDCVTGDASDFDLPALWRVNPEKNEIVSKRENGELRTSIIRLTNRSADKRFVVYQGVEPGGAWSGVIDLTTGNITTSISAGETDAYILYGTCTASLLK